MIRIIVVFTCAVALAMTIIRIASRQMKNQSLTGGWDDALVIASWLLALPITVVGCLMTSLGLGKDIWNFPVETSSPSSSSSTSSLCFIWLLLASSRSHCS